jgi:hypothetical protein
MKRYVIDTNVLLCANKAVHADEISTTYPELIIGCIDKLLSIKSGSDVVVLDSLGEIYSEYLNQHRIETLSLAGQPGVGDAFLKWLHDYQGYFPDEDRVELHKTDNGYEEFPIELMSQNIDPSDRKFFAVSNGHPLKPPIIEASDSKWWLWADACSQYGIHIEFVNERYMREMNHQ